MKPTSQEQKLGKPFGGLGDSEGFQGVYKGLG